MFAGPCSAYPSRARCSSPDLSPLPARPPFGPFISEFTIVSAALGTQQFWAGGLCLLLLGAVFIGMGATVLAVVQGTPPETAVPTGYHDTFATTAPIVLFLLTVLLLGLFIPPPLESLLRSAAEFLEGQR